jgi:hypothetical protein
MRAAEATTAGDRGCPKQISSGDTAPWLGGRFTDAQDQAWTQLRIPALLADPNYLDIAL